MRDAGEAYRAGWLGSRRGGDMPTEEEAFLTKHGDGWWSYWLDGWMDEARGREYMHRLNCLDACKDCQDDKCAGEEWY